MNGKAAYPNILQPGARMICGTRLQGTKEVAAPSDVFKWLQYKVVAQNTKLNDQ